jgi:hypothetical protein
MISDEFYKANLAYQIRNPFVEYYYDTLRIHDLEQIIDEPDRIDEIIAKAVIRPYMIHWAFKPGGPCYKLLYKKNKSNYI